jgi:hypothetical protein
MIINSIKKRMDVRTETIVGNRKNNAANENRIYRNRLIITLWGKPHPISVSTLRELSQDNIQKNRLQKKKNTKTISQIK